MANLGRGPGTGLHGTRRGRTVAKAVRATCAASLLSVASWREYSIDSVWLCVM
jgi:hypothetical protein